MSARQSRMIAPLLGIRLESEKPRLIPISNGFSFVCNDPSAAGAVPQELIDQWIEQYLDVSNATVHVMGDVADPWERRLDAMLYLELLRLTLWLTQESAVNIPSVLFVYSDAVGGIVGNGLPPVFPVTEAGEEAVFSATQFEKAASLLKLLLGPDPMAFCTSTTQPPHSIVAKETARERPMRAGHFTRLALYESDPALKIAHFSVALETLFGAGVDLEIAHQVAERIAWYREGDNNARLKTYSTVKKIYGVRSKVFHGATVKEGADALSHLTFTAAEMVRSILRDVIEDPDRTELFKLPDKELGARFCRLVLGETFLRQ